MWSHVPFDWNGIPPTKEFFMGTVLQFQVPQPVAEPRLAPVIGSAFAALLKLFMPREARRVEPASAERVAPIVRTPRPARKVALHPAGHRTLGAA